MVEDLVNHLSHYAGQGAVEKVPPHSRDFSRELGGTPQ